MTADFLSETMKANRQGYNLSVERKKLYIQGKYPSVKVIWRHSQMNENYEWFSSRRSKINTKGCSWGWRGMILKGNVSFSSKGRVPDIVNRLFFIFRIL